MPTTAADWTIRGKTCLITGPTAGIGRATALALGRLGADLVLVCRDRERGEALASEIGKDAGGGRCEVMIADLSSQQSIRDLARDFLARERPLHVLLNNAGVFELSRKTTVDGIETVFAVNHLAYFLLTHLLLDRLKASAPARIINVASDAHRWGTIDFDDLQGERSYRSMKIYGRSKLANILFTAELARRIEGSGVTVNSLHPGAVSTRLGAQNGAIARVLIGLLRPFMRTPENGAATSIHLATAASSANGEYFADCKVARVTSEARDPKVARRLWDVSAAMTGLAR